MGIDEKTQSASEVGEWRVGADSEPEHTGQDRDGQQPRECDTSKSPLFSLKMYLRRPTSADSDSTDSLTSQQSSTGIDCAGIVLKCLFCQFYDMIPLLPASCEKAANHCCPNYQQVVTTPQSPASSDEDSYVDWDCGLFASCKDASDCLELAMEVSELCYR